MKKVGLLFLHGFVSYIFFVIFGLIFWLGGPYGWLYQYGNTVLSVATALLVFFATLLSAKFLSKMIIFDKKDVQFVVFFGLILGLLWIWSGHRDIPVNDLVATVNNFIFLVVYSLTTFFFLKPSIKSSHF